MWKQQYSYKEQLNPTRESDFCYLNYVFIYLKEKRADSLPKCPAPEKPIQVSHVVGRNPAT